MLIEEKQISEEPVLPEILLNKNYLSRNEHYYGLLKYAFFKLHMLSNVKIITCVKWHFLSSWRPFLLAVLKTHRRMQTCYITLTSRHSPERESKTEPNSYFPLNYCRIEPELLFWSLNQIRSKTNKHQATSWEQMSWNVHKNKTGGILIHLEFVQIYILCPLSKVVENSWQACCLKAVLTACDKGGRWLHLILQCMMFVPCCNGSAMSITWLELLKVEVISLYSSFRSHSHLSQL